MSGHWPNPSLLKGCMSTIFRSLQAAFAGLILVMLLRLEGITQFQYASLHDVPCLV